MKNVFSGLALLAMALVLPLSASAENPTLKLQTRNGVSSLVLKGQRSLEVCHFDHPVASLDNLPEEVRSFMEQYEVVARRLADGVSEDELFMMPATANPGDTVGPLLGAIEFDQGYPYNNKCPVIGGGRAVTGCVATAMAQVMRYYKYPACGTGTATYTGSQGAATFDFATHPFDWDNILETYTYSATGSERFNTTQANAVANLMLACGASINMNYSADGSGSHTEYTVGALRDVFGYDASINCFKSSNPNEEDWTWTMQDEFDAGRPVIFGGQATSGGHCFILDGYTITGSTVYFHLNWGWNGHFNGWYRLASLKPEKDNYWNGQREMVVGIKPAGGAAVENTQASSAFNPALPVYNILGQRVAAETLLPGQIYIQQGRKIVF